MDNVYYQAETKNFTNALEFWEHINVTKESFHFHLYDTKFSEADWSVEPDRTMAHLCQWRAESIREKYDHVRIWYSAGRDSHHILKTFLDSNLKVDELLILDWSIMDRFKTDATIAYDTAVTTFKQYKKPLPKVTIFKPDQYEYDQYFHKDYFLNGDGYGTNYNFNINHYPNIIKFFPELSEKRRNICEVFGFEKSKIHMDDDGRFYFQMNDKNFNQGLGEANNLEWFYLSGDHPELAIKQSYLIMKFLKNTFKKTLTVNEVDHFQESRSSYDMFASILGRGSKISEQTGGGVNKTFGFNHNQYAEIFEAAKRNKWTALTHYHDFITHITILNEFESNEFWQPENQSFAGVPTQKYYLS